MTNISIENKNHIERENADILFDFGQYYRYTTPNTTLDQHFTLNEIYIVSYLAIHHISKNVHSLSFSIPAFLQKNNRTANRVSVKDVEQHFSFVNADTAKAERDHKLHEIEDSVKIIQHDMHTALTSPETIMSKILSDKNENIRLAVSVLDTSVPLLLLPATSSENLIASNGGQQVEILRKQLMNQQKLGNIISVYSNEKNTELLQLLNYSTDLHLEKAKAVQGQAHTMIQSFDDVESKIEQISLYLGEKVKIINICDKPVSPICCKFVFFSHMIFLDEEMLTHELFTDNSFDQYSINDFFDRLKNDTQFRDRILPTERCLVVVRPRYRIINYTECPFTNESLNVGNFSSFLIVRDGERINAIYSPIDYQSRLFPTQQEIEKNFITISDVNNTILTDAQKKLAKLSDMYTKVASILQGVADRQNDGGQIVFGDFVLNRFAGSLFDPVAIEQNVQFVNDEDFLLGNKPHLFSPKTWLDQHCNGEYKENDLIFIDAAVINKINVPQAYSKPNGDFCSEPEQTWDLSDNNNELKVVNFNDKERNHSIYINAINLQYNTKLYNTTRNMRVKLLSNISDYLNIRYIKLSELLDVMASRVARKHISNRDLMPSLIKAKKVIETLMVSYLPYTSQIQDELPHISEEDAYIAALNFVLSKDSAKFASPPQPKKGWINAICNIISQQASFSDEHYKQVKTFALSLNETAICIAQLPMKLVFVTGSQLQENFDMEQNTTEYLNKNIVFSDLKLYQILKNQEIALVGKLESKQALQLFSHHYYPLYSESDSINEQITERQLSLQKNLMARSYLVSLSFMDDLALIQKLITTKLNLEEKAKIKYFTSSFNLAINTTTEDDKISLLEALLSEITLPPYVEASDNEKRTVIAIARSQYIAGYGIRNISKLAHHSKNAIHAALVITDYFSMITQLLLALPEGSKQQALTQRFNDIAVDIYYVNDENLDSLKNRWSKQDAIRSFDVRLPFTHDIYNSELAFNQNGYEVDGEVLFHRLNS